MDARFAERPHRQFHRPGHAPRRIDSYAAAINNAGQVVGSSTVVETVLVYDEWGNCYYETYYYPHAFLWDAAGGMVDLQNQLLPGSDATLQYAQAINDGGSIAVNGYNGGGDRAYLLTPIPPGTPSISIADAPAVTEGNAGTVAATFTVTLSAASDQTVTVDYATADGSATAGSDYQAASGTLTFAPGETSKTITVLVNGDRLAEPNETFVVNLSSPDQRDHRRRPGVGTILDDEPTDLHQRRDGHGRQHRHRERDLHREPVGCLRRGGDGPLSHRERQRHGRQRLRRRVGERDHRRGPDHQDLHGRGDRRPVGGTDRELRRQPQQPRPTRSIVDGQGVGTILDDEPRISISDVTKAEGRKGKTTLFTFTVTLSAAYDQAVTMSFRTVNGTAKTSDNDYIAKTGTLTFAPGETTKTITIEVKGDSKREANETFYLDLFGNSSNSLFTKNRGIGTILNDD